MTALAETETADIIAAAYSGIGDKGYQGSDLITPFKKPQGGELLDWQKRFDVEVNRLRAPVERAIAHLKSWRILHTDYRRPLRTYVTSCGTVLPAHRIYPVRSGGSAIAR